LNFFLERRSITAEAGGVRLVYIQTGAVHGGGALQIPNGFIKSPADETL
jgi:primosomal replication protein N